MKAEQPYSQQDFEQNPGKYTLFRTARIAEPISSLPELAVGQLVYIRHFADQKNLGREGATMPIYSVWTEHSEALKQSPAMLYACALHDFCL